MAVREFSLILKSNAASLHKKVKKIIHSWQAEKL